MSLKRTRKEEKDYLTMPRGFSDELKEADFGPESLQIKDPESVFDNYSGDACGDSGSDEDNNNDEYLLKEGFHAAKVEKTPLDSLQIEDPESLLFNDNSEDARADRGSDNNIKSTDDLLKEGLYVATSKKQRITTPRAQWEEYMQRVVDSFESKFEELKNKMEKEGTTGIPTVNSWSDDQVFTKNELKSNIEMYNLTSGLFSKYFDHGSYFTRRPKLPEKGLNKSLKKAFRLLLTLLWSAPKDERNQEIYELILNNAKAERKVLSGPTQEGDTDGHLSMVIYLTGLYWDLSVKRVKDTERVMVWCEMIGSRDKHVNVLVNMMYVYVLVLLKRIKVRQQLVVVEFDEDPTVCQQWVNTHIPDGVGYKIMPLIALLGRDNPKYTERLRPGCLATYFIASKVKRQLLFEHHNDDGIALDAPSTLDIVCHHDDLWRLVRQVRRSMNNPNCKTEIPKFGLERPPSNYEVQGTAESSSSSSAAAAATADA